MSEHVPGSPHYYASQMLAETGRRFGSGEIPSSDPAFIGFVYLERAKLLEKEGPVEVPGDMAEFVQERLSRCGFHAFKADVGSIAELWDIFDDYEFQVMMGRRS
jgi:hypothetical protein